MKILHTEASPGWGGQEIRILKEAEGMRQRGHEIIFAIQKGGGLVEPAKNAGFIVYELPMIRAKIVSSFLTLLKIIRRHKIELINSHSSYDAWLAGFAARLCGCTIIRTRHLSTPIRKGINSRVLYGFLADAIVTTCEAVVPVICKQAKISPGRCRSIPTGVNPDTLIISDKEKEAFRLKYGFGKEDIVIGTLCILRSWKGISDFLQAASLLKDEPHLKWLIVGGGVSEDYFRKECKQLGLEDQVIFTGYLDKPYIALSAMDLFLLLSRANEGVSQASLQAAYLKKPLITTTVGGLPEVCVHDKTGFNVAVQSPVEVAKAIRDFIALDPAKRQQMGESAHQLVKEKFTLGSMLDRMEHFYSEILN